MKEFYTAPSLTVIGFAPCEMIAADASIENDLMNEDNWTPAGDEASGDLTWDFYE